MKDSLKNTRIAILTGQTVRKFMKLLMAEGQTVVYDRPIVKRIEDAAGNVLFSGLKYSSGWDCRVDISYVEQLKQLL